MVCNIKWRMTLHWKEQQKYPNVPPLRETVSDQVICRAPIINGHSQIQSGMTSKLTCSSFHTLSYRFAQWAENQYKVTLEIAHRTDNITSKWDKAVSDSRTTKPQRWWKFLWLASRTFAKSTPHLTYEASSPTGAGLFYVHVNCWQQQN